MTISEAKSTTKGKIKVSLLQPKIITALSMFNKVLLIKSQQSL